MDLIYTGRVYSLVNAVCPRVIETPMVADMLVKEPEAMKEVMRDQPIGRLGWPDEIASIGGN